MSGFDYEAATWGAGAVRPRDRTFAGFRLAEALVHLPARGCVLELGCGEGRFLRALGAVRPELELVGADVSRAALEGLRARAPDVETRIAEGRELPGADAEFDAVLVIDVLEHLADPAHALAEVRRVLRPGGVLHLYVPCEGDARSLWRWLPGQRGERALKRRLAGHVQRFRRGEILAQLRGLGLEPLRVRHSLHVLGNVADVAAFVRLGRARNRRRPGGPGARRDPGPRTTSDLLARESALVRAVDAGLWLEARLLGRIPSWSLHVSARKSAGSR